jgi:hypothetical protein
MGLSLLPKFQLSLHIHVPSVGSNVGLLEGSRGPQSRLRNIDDWIWGLPLDLLPCLRGFHTNSWLECNHYFFLQMTRLEPLEILDWREIPLREEIFQIGALLNA